MIKRNLISLLSVALLLAFAAAPSTARADSRRKVVVERFKGPKAQAKRAQATVEKVVARKHELLGASKKNRADAVVSGKVRRRGKRYTLELTVRTAAGKKVDTMRVPMRRKKLAPAAVAADLYDLLAWTEPRTSVAATEPAPADDDASPDLEADLAASDATLDDGPAVGDAALIAEVAPARAQVEGPRAQVRAGLALVGRTLTFTYQDSLAPEQRPTRYEGGMVGAVALQGELFPARLVPELARSRQLQRIGIAFDLDRAVGLKSRFDDAGASYELDTTQKRWGVDLLYRMPIRSATVEVAAGYSRLTHSIRRGTVELSLPDVAYRYYDVGGGVSVPVWGRLSAAADLRYLVVQEAGEIVMAENYGQASVAGYDIDAGARYALGERLQLRGGVRYLRMALDFAGTGPMSTDLDGDPDQDVGGARDRYLGFYLLGGYAF